MANATITEEQFGAEIRSHERKHRTAIVRGLMASAYKGLPVVVADTPVDRGQAKNAWRVILYHGEGADLVNTAPHAGILEAGSRPHWAPLMPILRWVVRKFGLDLNGGRRSFESISDVPWPTYMAAKTIQKNIAQNGTKPHGMIKNNLKRLASISKTQVEIALRTSQWGDDQ